MNLSNPLVHITIAAREIRPLGQSGESRVPFFYGMRYDGCRLSYRPKAVGAAPQQLTFSMKTFALISGNRQTRPDGATVAPLSLSQAYRS